MKVIKWVLTIIPTLIFAFAIFITINVALAYRNNTIPNIFGYSYMVVKTGSMQPTILIDDMIVVRIQDSYEVDDIVTFYYDIGDNGTLDIVTHRIESIVGDVITVRGDAATDPNDYQEIEADDIIGKVVFTSTFLGQLFSLNFIQNKNIIFIILISGLSIFLVYQIVHIIKIRKED